MKKEDELVNWIEAQSIDELEKKLMQRVKDSIASLRDNDDEDAKGKMYAANLMFAVGSVAT